jgi:hypothetical protein
MHTLNIYPLYKLPGFSKCRAAPSVPIRSVFAGISRTCCILGLGAFLCCSVCYLDTGAKHSNIEMHNLLVLMGPNNTKAAPSFPILVVANTYQVFGAFWG